MHSKTKIEKIEEVLKKHQAPSFVLAQIKHAIYKEGILDYEKITTLPKSLRTALKSELGDVLSLKNIFETEGGQAHKVLFETRDGQKIESVRMLFRPDDDVHESICISSQSGCALGCKFCATGGIGFKKNLTSEEISDQVLYFRTKYDTGSISFMGMGEPLSNPDNVFDALKTLTDPLLLGISDRKINVSTVGIVPQIKRLNEEFPQVNLAFSLHSPFSKQRKELMPITNAYPIDEVFKVLDERIILTKRRIFLAYILLGGVNDSDEHVKGLVDVIKKRGKHSYLYHVNLIRFHPGPMELFDKPSIARVGKFQEILNKNNISNSLRQSFGLNIYAACGQLYGGYNKK
jgi:23S rRNA (adenine-C8)-methyltransferase